MHIGTYRHDGLSSFVECRPPYHITHASDMRQDDLDPAMPEGSQLHFSSLHDENDVHDAHHVDKVSAVYCSEPVLDAQEGFLGTAVGL